MKSIRQILVAMAGLALAFVTSCNTTKQQEVYYLIAVNMQVPYWQTVANGFNKSASTYNAKPIVVGPKSYDPVAELDALQQAIRAKPSGILISVSDASVLEREINNAVQHGIPVITVDSDAEITRRLFFIGTNNMEAGRLGGSRLIDKLGGKGNVAFFTIPGQPNLEERLAGFKQVLNTQPGIKIAEIVDVKAGTTEAFDKAAQLITRTGPGKINAFVCLEAVSGKPVVDAIKRAQANDRVVITWDTDQGILDAILDGTIDSTIAQKPYTMGYFGLKLLHDVFNAPPPLLNKDFTSDFFSPFPAFVDTGTTLVDKSNAGLYSSAAAANR